MSISVETAHEVIGDGIVFTDPNTKQRVLYLTQGSASPMGSPAPINTWYFRTGANHTLWYKYGSGDNDWRQVHASEITAFDTSLLPNDNGYNSTVQAILTKLLAGDTPAVSQTMIFGDGGNSTSGSYLPNQGVPSNVVGVPVGLSEAALRSFFLDNENTRTGNVFVEADGVVVYTAALNNQSKIIVTGLNIPIATNSEVSVRLGVSLKNAKVVLNINGDAA